MLPKHIADDAQFRASEKPAPTKEQIKAALEAYVDLCKEVANQIRHATKHGPFGGLPSGELYAQLCGTFDLAKYEDMLLTLESAGLIKRQGHLLVYTGS